MNELGLARYGALSNVRPAPEPLDPAVAWLSAAGDAAMRRAWIVALWALAGFALALGAATFLIGHDTHSTAAYLARFLLATGRRDSWGPMIQAVDELRAAPDALLYTKLFFEDHLKFQYPISSLLLPDVVQRVTGAGWPAVIKMLNGMSWVVVWAAAVVCWRLFTGRDGCLVADAAPIEKLLLAGGIVAMTLLFYPFTRSYVLGQIQTTITLLVAISLLAWRADRKWLVGVCLGICCTIKPQWGLVFAWAMLRREWTMTVTGALTGGAIALVAGMLYGFHQYLDYLPVISYLAQHGESYFPNQSLNGLMNRLLGTGNNLEWVGDAFAAYHPVVHVTTIASSLLLLSAALLYRRRAKADALDLAVMILSLTMASPIAWEHHYGALLPIFALAAPIAVERKPFGRATIPLLLIAFVVASERFDLTNRLWDTVFNPLQSYLYFAAAVVLVLLYRLAGADTAPRRMATAPATSSGTKPLCVDLDGTLIRTDILVESLLAAGRSWAALKCLPRLLWGGKAALKAGLARACPVSCELLPYDEDVLSFLRERKAQGERLILVTGTNIAVAERINAHLGHLFDEVMASDRTRNLRGENKARALVERFGEGGFVYIGNDSTDLATWQHAAGAMIVGASADLVRRARMIAHVECVFDHRPSVLHAALKEIRPQQWLKNLLVFVPIVTSGDVLNLSTWTGGLIAFAAFCAAASGVYLVNDLLDLDADRRHPRKRMRPLASGALPITYALVIAPALFLIAALFATYAGILPLVVGYAALSIAYSARLKMLPLVDVFVLGALYTIRLYAGGLATEHPVSLWLLAFSGFLFLGLALMKRVVELRDEKERGGDKLARRGYVAGDIAILAAFGTASTFISSMVLALYVSSDWAARMPTYNAYALWATVPLLLFWQCRLWLASARGYMTDDPIVFTARDWVSALVAGGLLIAMAVARTPL
jgi:4-hydroxybenzoate polyprenyltransferase